MSGVNVALVTARVSLTAVSHSQTVALNMEPRSICLAGGRQKQLPVHGADHNKPLFIDFDLIY